MFVGEVWTAVSTLTGFVELPNSQLLSTDRFQGSRDYNPREADLCIFE
jgi:hypothetical protein